MYFKQQIITPDTALDMLRRNNNNRRLNKKRVQILISDIKRGQWTESPQPISFDRDGNLLDGQHRLSAVALAGVPITAIVAYDVPKNAVIDRVLERPLEMRCICEA